MALQVEIARTLPLSAEDVFDAWLDPVAMAHFLCPGDGVTVKDVVVDPVVGGAFSLKMVAGETIIPIRGEYQVIDRARTLAFRWLSARTTDDSIVTLTFEVAGEGTLMTLRHTGFPDGESRDDHAGGWAHIIERLGSI